MAEYGDLVQLRDILADLYPVMTDLARVVEQAEIPLAYLTLTGKAINDWHEVLREARRRGRVGALVAVAADEYPEHPILGRVAAARDRLSTLPVARGRDIDDWHLVPQPEAILGGRSTLLPIGFLETGVRRAEAVCLITVGGRPSGTGWALPGDWILTNNHVLPSQKHAYDARAIWGYNALDHPNGWSVPLQPGRGFATDPALDWTLVRAPLFPNETRETISEFADGVRPGDPVVIVQHAGGGPKTIGLVHNLCTYADNTLVQYLTDTMPGSSGSPVFDMAWRVVALHHSGGWTREPGTQRLAYRNQGSAIRAVLNAIRQAGIVLPL